MFNVGLIGAGDFGRYLGKIASQITDVDLVAVATPHPEKTRALTERANFNVYEDHLKMLSAQPLDAVIVASPSYSHFPIVMDAIACGVHVFCEKPLAHTVADCDRMICAAEHKGIKLMVGHVLRWMPFFQKIHETYQHLGNPLFAHLIRIERPELWGWYRQSSKIRSIVHEVGVHELDMLRWLMGEIQQVEAIAAPCSRQDLEVEDTILIQLLFLNGAIGTYSLSWNCPLEASCGYFISTKGGLHYDWRGGNILETITQDGKRTAVKIEEAEEQNGYYRELEAFFAWMKGGLPPAVTAQDARAAVAIAEAALQSIRTKHPVDLASL